MKDKDLNTKGRKGAYDTLLEAFNLGADELSVEDIERMFHEKINKPLEKMDFDLIHECLLTFDYLKKDKDKQ